MDAKRAAAEAYEPKAAKAREIARYYTADVIAMAWRIAMEREGHKLNKGHLT